MTVSWTHLYSVKTRCFTYQLSLLSSSTLMFWDDIQLKKLSWSLKRETLLKFPLPSQPQAATTTRLSSQGSLEKAATFISGNTKILSLQIQKYHIRNCKNIILGIVKILYMELQKYHIRKYKNFISRNTKILYVEAQNCFSGNTKSSSIDWQKCYLLKWNIFIPINAKNADPQDIQIWFCKFRNSASAIQYKIRKATNIFSGKKIVSGSTKDLLLTNSKSRITHYRLNSVTFAFSIKNPLTWKKLQQRLCWRRWLLSSMFMIF